MFLIALSAFIAALVINELYRYLRSRPSAKPMIPKEHRNDKPISTPPVHNYQPKRLDRDIPASLTYKVQIPTPAVVADTTVELSAEYASESLCASNEAIAQLVDDAPSAAPNPHDAMKDLSAAAPEDSSAVSRPSQPSLAIHRITQSPFSTYTQDPHDYRLADRIDPWERQYEHQFKTIEDVLRQDTTNLLLQTSTLMPVVKRLMPLIQQLHGQAHFCSADEQSAIRNGLASLFDLFRLSNDPMKVERLVAKRQPNDVVVANLSWLVITDAQKLDPATTYALSHCLQRALLNDIPFGGVRIILVGDFLSPIRDMADDVKDNLLERFGSLSCLAAPPIQQVPLRKIALMNMDTRKTYRLRESLSRIVSGNVTRSDFQLIQPKPVDNDFLTLVRNHEEAIHINDRMAEQIGEKRAVFVCQRSQHVRLDMLPCPERLSVCVGARVVFLTNHVDDIWFRGCLGTVTSMRADRIHVQVDNGATVVVERHTWQAPMHHKAGLNNQGDQFYHAVTQFPLALGWAMDVGAAQEMSIPRLHIHDVVHSQGNSSLLYSAINAAADIASVSSSTTLTPAAFRVADNRTAMALGHVR